MFRVINEYMEKVTLCTDTEVYNMLSGFLDEYSKDEIKKYCINVNVNRFVVDIRLRQYSIEASERVFNAFNDRVSYPYSALHVRYNEGKCVRYRYITCKEDKNGFYCDIVIS